MCVQNFFSFIKNNQALSVQSGVPQRGHSETLPAMHRTFIASNLRDLFIPYTIQRPEPGFRVTASSAFKALWDLNRHQGQPFGPSAQCLPTIAQVHWVTTNSLGTTENGFLQLIGCQAQSILCPQELVSMTNLSGRVRAFPHSLLPRENNCLCRCGQIKYILVKRQCKALGHWQCSELLICGILFICLVLFLQICVFRAATLLLLPSYI